MAVDIANAVVERGVIACIYVARLNTLLVMASLRYGITARQLKPRAPLLVPIGVKDHPDAI